MISLKNTNKVSPTLLYVEIISFHIGNWEGAAMEKTVFPILHPFGHHREEIVSPDRESPV